MTEIQRKRERMHIKYICSSKDYKKKTFYNITVLCVVAMIQYNKIETTGGCLVC